MDADAYSQKALNIRSKSPIRKNDIFVAPSKDSITISKENLHYFLWGKQK
jgi:hypothetical protein